MLEGGGGYHGTLLDVTLSVHVVHFRLMADVVASAGIRLEYRADVWSLLILVRNLFIYLYYECISFSRYFSFI